MSYRIALVLTTAFAVIVACGCGGAPPASGAVPPIRLGANAAVHAADDVAATDGVENNLADDSEDDVVTREPLLEFRYEATHRPQGANAHTWSIRVLYAEEVVFRLYRIRGGHRRTEREIRYSWKREDWLPQSEPVAGEVLSLFQSGEPFSQKALQRVSFTAHIDDDQVNLVNRHRVEEFGDVLVLKEELAPHFEALGGTGSVSVGREEVFHSNQLDPPAPHHSSSGRPYVMADLVERSKNRPGLLFLVATVEWTPLERMPQRPED